MSRIPALLLFALLLPFSTQASVVINEIAWMGTDASANCEWVEFRNTGGDVVPLSGWSFTIANSGSIPRTITLSGSVGAGEYFVLARNTAGCPEAVTEQAGYTFTSFGNGISNTAAILTLSSPQGEEDKVDASGGWKDIGGENAPGKPRKTAQKAASGWITALPTPMQENAQGGSTDTPAPTPSPDTGTTTPAVTIGGAAPAEGPLADSPARTLKLDAGVNRYVLAGAHTPFLATAYSETGRANHDADISWSFGDGAHAVGDAVSHVYRIPGTYLVTVRAQDEEAHVVRTITVIAEAPGIDVAAVPEGTRITNTGARIADLSGWSLLSNGRSFTIPRDTAILPRSSVIFPHEVTRLATSSDVVLRFPEGKEAVRYAYVPAEVEAEETLLDAQARPALDSMPQPPPVVRGIQNMKKVDLPASVPVQAHEEVIEAPAAATQQAAAGAALPSRKAPNWLKCLFGNLLACGAAVAVP